MGMQRLNVREIYAVVGKGKMTHGYVDRILTTEFDKVLEVVGCRIAV
jgi:hypothetical protein